MIRMPWGSEEGAPPPDLDRIVDHLSEGGVLAYPTETVYGLGSAATEEAVGRVQALKGRGDAAPFLVLLPAPGRPEEAPERWGLTLGAAARAAARGLWPGPLTMVLSDPEARFPPGIRSDAGGVAVRVSSHPFVEALMDRWENPLVSTSANRTGAGASCSVREIEAAFASRAESDRLWIVDAGGLPGSPPSTVVDFTSDPPRILREGALSAAVVSRFAPGIVS